MISIWIRHYLECFYFRVYMLYDYSLARESFVIQFICFAQLSFLFGFSRYSTVLMKIMDSLIP